MHPMSAIEREPNLSEILPTRNPNALGSPGTKKMRPAPTEVQPNVRWTNSGSTASRLVSRLTWVKAPLYSLSFL